MANWLRSSVRFLRYAAPALAVSAVIAAPAREDSAARAHAAVARLPLHFESNAGQWDAAVRFAAHGDGYLAVFTSAGPSLILTGGRRIDLALEGARPAPEIEGAGRVPLRTDYFIGARRRWRTQVPVFSSVVYRGVYPGIDVAYYGNASCLEYDFRIQAGADPLAIRLRVYGVDRVGVDQRGDLSIEAAGAHLLQKLPFVYQTDPRTGVRRRIEGGYALLAPNEVGFRVASYDRARPLVIDPYLVYSSYWGGTAADEVVAVKTGPNGLLYVVGETLTSDLVATPSNYAAGNARVYLNNLFILLLDTTAAGDYSTYYLSYFGGAGGDQPTAIDIDSAGYLYITGYTGSSDFPLAGNSVQTSMLSTTNTAFAMVFNPYAAGTDALIYSTYIGGSLDNYGYGIAAGGNGSIYVIGSTTSVDFPVTANAYASSLWGPQDAFLCQIDMGDALMPYATYLGGEGTDDGRAIAVDAHGLVYFAIDTDSTLFPLGYLPGEFPFRTTLQGVRDAVIGVMDMTQPGTASLVYDTYFGGSDDDEVEGIALRPDGKLLVTGYTFSQNFPVTANAVQPMPLGETDAFASIVDVFPPTPAQFMVYSTYLGGSSSDVAYAVAGDTAGNIYLTGYTMSSDFPITPDAVQTQWGQGIDVFVAKIQPGVSGSAGLLFSTFIGGLGFHVANTLSLGSEGEVFVGGYTNLGLPAAGDNANLYGGGYDDGFVLALTQLAGQPIPRPSPASARRSGAGAPVPGRDPPPVPGGFRGKERPLAGGPR